MVFAFLALVCPLSAHTQLPKDVVWIGGEGIEKTGPQRLIKKETVGQFVARFVEVRANNEMIQAYEQGLPVPHVTIHLLRDGKVTSISVQKNGGLFNELKLRPGDTLTFCYDPFVIWQLFKIRLPLPLHPEAPKDARPIPR